MNTKNDIIHNISDLVRSLVEAMAFVLGGAIMLVGIILGVIWVPLSEGMNMGCDFVDDLLDYIDPLDEEDEL